jgi:hypothetical protein
MEEPRTEPKKLKYEIGENLATVLIVGIIMLGLVLCMIFGHP